MHGSDPLVRLRIAQHERRGRRVLGRVELDVAPGERIALLGPNGAGKTTLLRLLAGIDRPTHGSVDHPAAGPRRRARARHVAVGSQAPPAAIGWTVRELVTLARTPDRPVGPLRDHDRHRVDDALGLLGIRTWQARRVDRLSGGERQLVDLARVAAQDASLLLLDEPLAHLDPANAAHVLDVLDAIARGTPPRAVLCVLHEPSHAIAWADRIVLLRDGEVVADTPTHRLTDEVLGACYDTPVRIARDDSGAPVAAVLDRGGVLSPA